MDEEMDEQTVEVYEHSFEDSSDEATDSLTRVQDAQAYRLLFGECDSEQSGWANVNSLILFIKGVLSGSSEGHSSADSDEGSAEIEYNLDLLRHMLNCHAVKGSINEASYNQVIDKWVQDVRSNSSSSRTSCSQERDDLQEEEELISPQDSYSICVSESFETTGGGTSTSETDGAERIESLEVENRRLVDRNQTLQSQMELCDKQIRMIETENRELQSKVKSQQQGLALLDVIKAENDDLAGVLQQEQKDCLDMKTQVENLQQEIRELNTEVSELQNLLTHSNNERDDFEKETQALQHQLLQTESKLRVAEEERQTLQVLVEDQQFETANLQDALANTSETVQELKTANSQLQSSLSQRGVVSLPMSSTPFRPHGPSLQEELIQSGLSDFAGSNGSICLEISDAAVQEPQKHYRGAEYFSSVLAKAQERIQQRTKQLESGLSEIIEGPSGGGGNGDKHRSKHGPDITESFSQVFESKLTKLQQSRRKEHQRNQKLVEEIKQLYKENDRLRKENRKQENEQLKERDIETEEKCTNFPEIVNSEHLMNGREPSGVFVQEDELSMLTHMPASSISLVHTLVQTDPILPLESEVVTLLPRRVDEAEIERDESPFFSESLVQPQTKTAGHTLSPKEDILHKGDEVPSTNGEGRSSDTSGDDYLSISSSHLTTSSPPVHVVSSGSESGNTDALRTHDAPVTNGVGESPVVSSGSEKSSTNALRTRDAPVIEDVSDGPSAPDAPVIDNGEKPVSLTTTSERTSKVLSADSLPATFGTSDEISVSSPLAGLESSEISDDTGAKVPVLASQFQEEKGSLGEDYQAELVKPDCADKKIQTLLSLANDKPELTSRASSLGRCIRGVSRALYSLLKSVVWLMLLAVLIIALLVILIEFHGTLKECGGRVCHRPFLFMILGQNLRYTHNGPVAM